MISREDHAAAKAGSANAGDGLICCDKARLVYECPGPCGRRVLEDQRDAYATFRTCEECYQDTPHRPGTFPSQMDLIGVWCAEHSTGPVESSALAPAPHLAARQPALFRPAASPRTPL